MKKLVKMLTLLVMTIVLAVSAVVFSSAADTKWTAAWGTAPTQIAIDGYDNIAAILRNVTARTVITSTTGGSKIRLRFSNYYGTRPLKLEMVTVAKSAVTSITPADATSEIDQSTLKYVTFNGSKSVEIPAGKEIYSDAISFKVNAMENIAISMYAKEASEIKTMGLSGGSTFLDFGGNSTESKTVGISNKVANKTALQALLKLAGISDLKLSVSIVSIVPCLASMDVLADKDSYSVAVIGDSTITNEFPMYLAEQISKTGTKNVGVLGKGILGNRLLGEGLGYVGLVFGESLIDRLERDVLSQSNIKYVIVKIGANDIMHPVCTDIAEQYPDIQQPTAEEIIEGYRTVFQMCHDAGKKVIAIGITQWKGNTRNYFNTGDKYLRTDEEFNADWQIALDVNSWLSKSKEHDGYINFNDISKSEDDPAAFRPEYTVDGAHPTDLLQQVWAQNFPLKLVGVTQHVLGVKMNSSTAKINVGKTKKLSATVSPSNAVNKKLTWSSSNTAVATVSADGTVKAIKNGTATITCKSVDSGLKSTCKVTVVTAPTGVKLNKTKATVNDKKTVQLTATVSPSTATNKSVKWTSSNKKVATVDKNGLVKAVAPGKAIITCKTVDSGKTVTCVVTVKAVKVKSIKLNKTSANVNVGSTLTLKPTFNPTNASNQNVTWKTSDKKIATVSSKGVVKGVKAGKVTITCTTKDGSKVAKCTITVKNVKMKSIKLNKTAVEVISGNTYTLKATVSPSNTTNKKLTWTSSNTKVAKVNSSGKITAVGAGKATITCKSADGSVSAKCTVTVPKVVAIGIKLDITKLTMQVGATYKLNAQVLPANATNKKVIWSTTNSKVATVDSNGKVKAVGKGTCRIKVKSAENNTVETCVVTVK
ncbi:MAG: Ig-like domain-containing protein [Faecalibacterium sp.]|nr:Ig-like domain-containing protein [Ruminococcus sp.]MCM1392770.1 Ig-like domain-containing protein [Ruminococcus sp.]MCM1485324.1 Ig-like domain-containing protein [Faecalibacterium sp.]